MEQQVQELLEGVSYEELKNALETKKNAFIDELKQKRAVLIKEKRKIEKEYDVKIEALNSEIVNLRTGSVDSAINKTRKRTGGKNLTRAVKKVIKERAGDGIRAADVVDILPEFGYTGDLEQARRSIGVCLANMNRKGIIERVDRGVYKYSAE